MADEIYLNLVRQFVGANNEFLPFAYVMLPACIISLDVMCPQLDFASVRCDCIYIYCYTVCYT